MNTVGRSEAAAALEDIGRRRGQVADVAMVPFWYWLVIAVPMVGLAAIVDTQVPTAIGFAIAAFVLVVLAATALVVVPRYRRAQWRSDLLGGRGAIAIVACVWVLGGGTLGVGFGLRAAQVGHPATIACALGGVAMVIGGPMLMRLLHGIMGSRA
jgi:hypothetical protein